MNNIYFLKIIVYFNIYCFISEIAHGVSKKMFEADTTGEHKKMEENIESCWEEAVKTEPLQKMFNYATDYAKEQKKEGGN